MLALLPKTWWNFTLRVYIKGFLSKMSILRILSLLKSSPCCKMHFASWNVELGRQFENKIYSQLKDIKYWLQKNPGTYKKLI